MKALSSSNSGAECSCCPSFSSPTPRFGRMKGCPVLWSIGGLHVAFFDVDAAALKLMTTALRVASSCSYHIVDECPSVSVLPASRPQRRGQARPPQQVALARSPTRSRLCFCATCSLRVDSLPAEKRTAGRGGSRRWGTSRGTRRMMQTRSQAHTVPRVARRRGGSSQPHRAALLELQRSSASSPPYNVFGHCFM